MDFTFFIGLYFLYAAYRMYKNNFIEMWDEPLSSGSPESLPWYDSKPVFYLSLLLALFFMVLSFY